MATSVNSVCAALWWTSIRRAQQSRQPPSRDPASATERYTGVLPAADELIGHSVLWVLMSICLDLDRATVVAPEGQRGDR